MNPVLAFVVVMVVWTVSEFVAKKTKSLLSSLFVASMIFLVGFLTGIFPDDLLGELVAAGAGRGRRRLHHRAPRHDDQPRRLQEAVEDVPHRRLDGARHRARAAGWPASSSATASAAARPTATRRRSTSSIAGTGALSGGTISVIIVQEAALGVGLTSHRHLPGAHRRAPGAHRLPADLDHPAPGGRPAQGRVPRGHTSPAVEAEEEGGRRRKSDAARPPSAPPPAPCSSSASSCSSRWASTTSPTASSTPSSSRCVFGIAAAHLRGLQALGAGRHRLARPDDDRDHDPGLRTPGHGAGRRPQGAGRSRCSSSSSSGSPASPASRRWSASCSATASRCRWPSGSPRSTASPAR